MDFIERWFHVSPDGGNGLLEVLYVVAIVAVLLMVIFRHRLTDLLSRFLGSLGDRENKVR